MKWANKNAMQGRWRWMRLLRNLDLQPFCNAHRPTARSEAKCCAVLKPNQSQYCIAKTITYAWRICKNKSHPPFTVNGRAARNKVKRGTRSLQNVNFQPFSIAHCRTAPNAVRFSDQIKVNLNIVTLTSPLLLTTCRHMSHWHKECWRRSLQ